MEGGRGRVRDGGKGWGVMMGGGADLGRSWGLLLRFWGVVDGEITGDMEDLTRYRRWEKQHCDFAKYHNGNSNMAKDRTFLIT